MLHFKVTYFLLKESKAETETQIYHVLTEQGLESLITRYREMMEKKGFSVTSVKKEPAK